MTVIVCKVINQRLYLSLRIPQVVSGEEEGEGEEGGVVDDERDEKVVRVEVAADSLENDVSPEAQVVQAEHAGAAKEDGEQGVLHNFLLTPGKKWNSDSFDVLPKISYLEKIVTLKSCLWGSTLGSSLPVDQSEHQNYWRKNLPDSHESMILQTWMTFAFLSYFRRHFRKNIFKAPRVSQSNNCSSCNKAYFDKITDTQTKF